MKKGDSYRGKRENDLDCDNDFNENNFYFYFMKKSVNCFHILSKSIYNLENCTAWQYIVIIT